MKSALMWTLIAINVLLIASFLNRVGVLPMSNSAVAQPAQPPARPGDYLMIPARISGDTNGVVYVLDTTNSKLSAMTYNVSRNRLEMMPNIDLIPIFQQRVQPATPGRGNR